MGQWTRRHPNEIQYRQASRVDLVPGLYAPRHDTLESTSPPKKSCYAMRPHFHPTAPSLRPAGGLNLNVQLELASELGVQLEVQLEVQLQLQVQVLLA